jgi:hypothetical protein
MTLLSHCTSVSMEKNNISLDQTVKDDWGLPAPRITFEMHPDDMATMKWFVEREREILEAAGANKIWSFPIRHSGRTRWTCHRAPRDRSRCV